MRMYKKNIEKNIGEKNVMKLVKKCIVAAKIIYFKNKIKTHILKVIPRYSDY